MFETFVFFGKALVDLLREFQIQNSRLNNEAADYLEQLGNAMAGVVAELRAHKVHRINGNEMNTLIHAYDQKNRKVIIPGGSQELKAALEKQIEIANQLDFFIR